MTSSLELSKDDLQIAVKAMSDDELAKEYNELIEVRKSGRERKYPDLQMRLEVLVAERKSRSVKSPAQAPEAAKTPEGVEMIQTPQSRSIEMYGYDAVLKILYVKYKSGKQLYTYTNVSEETFNALEKAESKGKFILNNITRRYKPQAAAKAAGKD